MTAGTYDITIEQGAKYSQSITVTGRNLTGYTARMHVRSSVGSPTVLLELTTENGRIAITPATDSVIVLTVDATDTDDLNFSRGVYDLELIPASGEADVERLLQGLVILSDEVTRPAPP